MRIARVSEEGSAFGWREKIESIGDGVPKGVESSFSGLAQPGLEFGKELLNGIKVRAVGRQQHTCCADGFDGLANRENSSLPHGFIGATR